MTWDIDGLWGWMAGLVFIDTKDTFSLKFQYGGVSRMSSNYMYQHRKQSLVKQGPISKKFIPRSTHNDLLVRRITTLEYSRSRHPKILKNHCIDINLETPFDLQEPERNNWNADLLWQYMLSYFLDPLPALMMSHTSGLRYMALHISTIFYPGTSKRWTLQTPVICSGSFNSDIMVT